MSARPVLAQSVSLRGARPCPELGVKPTCRLQVQTSQFDPNSDMSAPEAGGTQNLFQPLARSLFRDFVFRHKLNYRSLSRRTGLCSTSISLSLIVPLLRLTSRTRAYARLLPARSRISDVLNGLGEPKRSEVQKLYHSSDLTILNVIWAPRMTIMPHNHQMWAVIGVYTGREDNIFWRRVPGGGGKLDAARCQGCCRKMPSPLVITSFIR